MAAEALFGLDANITPNMTPEGKLDTTGGPRVINPAWLTTGNRHASKFTATEAEKLAAEWDVVEHISNTTTGFSGWLIKRRRVFGGPMSGRVARPTDQGIQGS
jgi:hypothetical protein